MPSPMGPVRMNPQQQQPQRMVTFMPVSATCQCGVDRIFVKKQLYQLMNTNCQFYQSFDAFSFHKLVNET